ncbi:MAG: hypothetical protein WDO19_14220 [Bacteroidota bacterium]
MIKEEKAWQQGDRNGITVFKSEGLTLVITCLKKGANLADVRTEGYSTLFLVTGKLRCRSGDEEKLSQPGDVLIFHPLVVYSIFAEEETAFLLTHYMENDTDDSNRFI